MTKPTSPVSIRRSRPPLWLLEGLEVVERRRRLLVATAAAVLVLGLLTAVVFPSVLAPTLVTGVGVGLAAVLLGIAATIAADATDLLVRGPRHVRASGGELVAVLPSRPSPEHAAPLATAVLEAREDEDGPLRIALAASGREVGKVAAWTDELAVALAETGGVSVLRVDLVSGATGGPGLLEVVRDGARLASAVEIREGTKLARMGAGADPAAALAALPSLASSLPRDLDVLLVALPAAASRQVVASVGPFDHVLVVADRGRTSRVELIAGLDAIESAGTAAQVVLIDDVTSSWLAPTGPAVGDEPGRRADVDTAPDTGQEPVADAERAEPTGNAADVDGAEESSAEASAAASHAAAAASAAASNAAAAESAEDPESPEGEERADGSEEPDAAAMTEHSEEPGAAVNTARPEEPGAAEDAEDPTGADDAVDVAGEPGDAPDDVVADDPDDRAVDPRDVEVLIGAATVNAEALTAAETAAEGERGPWNADGSPSEPETAAESPSSAHGYGDPATEQSDPISHSGPAELRDAPAEAHDDPDDELDAPSEAHDDPDDEHDAPSEAHDDVDATDEIPRAEAPGRRHDDAEEDLLRTTAQLAILELAHDEPVDADRPAADDDRG